MALVKAPLFGLDAKGQLGKSIVFSSWRGRQYVRRLSIPKNPKTGLQVGMRSTFKFITETWDGLSVADKNTWTELAAATNITLMNASVQLNQRNARRNLGIRPVPNATPVALPAVVTSLAATAQPKTLVVGWADPATTVGNYCNYVYLQEGASITPDISNLVFITPIATLTATLTNLKSGTEYSINVRQGNDDGDLGQLGADIQATPL